MTLPDGWTEDLSLIVAPDCTLDELVDYVLASDCDGSSRRQVMRTLTTHFGLSYESARLALDRVHGGRSRAATSSPANEPDPTKDPVAYISYQRVRGKPAPPSAPRHTPVWAELCARIGASKWGQAQEFVRDEPFNASAAPAEKEAAQLWSAAFAESSQETRAPMSVDGAMNMVQLGELTAAAQPRPASMSNIVLQASTAISLIGEKRIRDLGYKPHANEGSTLWYSAIKLADGVSRLAALSREIGDDENELRALRKYGRITTALLGQCPERFGPVMIAHANCLKKAGRIEEAVSNCDAIVSDFQQFPIEQWEPPLADEKEIIAHVMLDALDFIRRERGTLEPALESLRLNCVSSLSSLDETDET